jgi:hypothetical protein
MRCGADPAGVIALLENARRYAQPGGLRIRAECE